MKDLQKRRYEMLIRVRDFGASHAADFAANTVAGQIFVEIAAIVGKLEGHAVIQSVGKAGAIVGSTSKATARIRLRQDLEAISLAARALSPKPAGVEDKFRLPRKGSDRALLTAARAFLQDVEPLGEEFIKHEMPPAFLADLREDIEALEAAISDRNRSTESRVKATASLEASIEQGMGLLERLDALMRNKFRNDGPAISAWESASHVERNKPRPIENRKTVSSRAKSPADGLPNVAAGEEGESVDLAVK